MKTSKILATLALTGVLGTSLYASCDVNGKKGLKEGKSSHSSKHVKKRTHRGERGHLALLKKLNLTDKQKEEIKAIREDLMKKRLTTDVAFTKDGFDKAKFVEIMKEKRENRIESQAEMIDRVYKVLTDKQKEQLKVLMELRKEKMTSMKDKRNKLDKNSNGRG